jgi:hypothetical protein
VIKFVPWPSTRYKTVKVQGVAGADFTRILRLSVAPVFVVDMKIPPYRSEAVAVPWFTQVNDPTDGGAVKGKSGPQRANAAPVSRSSMGASVGKYRLPAL